MTIELSSLQTLKRRVAQKIFASLERALAPHQGKSVALSVSGGLDSRALMEAVARWPQRFSMRFMVVVVNHHARQESSAEARAVLSRARLLGFEAEVLPVFVTKKSEAVMREARYNAISAELTRRGIGVLCTAHQKDDDAEGLIMDLFGFGGGANGAGIQQERPAKFGTLVRPFLDLQRADLLLFLTSIGVTDFFRDPSNEDGSCARQKARDFLRHEARSLSVSPINRLSEVAQKREQERVHETLCEVDPDRIALCVDTSPHLLRIQLQQAYRQVCPERDPRNARSAIETVIKKAASLALIGTSGVDPSANSITVRRPERLNFDLPGAKVLMTPAFLSLYRNQNDLLVQ